MSTLQRVVPTVLLRTGLFFLSAIQPSAAPNPPPQVNCVKHGGLLYKLANGQGQICTDYSLLALVQTPPPYLVQDSEPLAGAMDGVNSQFSVLSPPLGSSLHIYRNGLRLTAGQDYMVSSPGNLITFLPGQSTSNGLVTGFPQPGDILIADYRCTPSPTCQ